LFPLILTSNRFILKHTIISALLVLFVLIFQSNSTFGQIADDLVGTWLTTDGKSKVEIKKDPNTQVFSGTVIWLKNPTDDEGNPTKDPKGQIVMGMKILTNFIFDGDEWADGEIYDPESGDDYYCNITMINENKIKVRGSLDSMGWIGRTVYWMRVMQ
jgi:uncharacterized protein (DUF2147 family)